MKIRSIMCCCGQGLGSSMMVQMNVERYFDKYKIDDVTVNHCPLAEANPYKADLFIIGLDLERQFEGYERVVVLNQLIDMEELDKKLTSALTTYEETFRIK